MKGIKILAIETSCDETAAAVIQDGREVLSNVVSTQIELHTQYGGVVPEIASRMHIEQVNQVIREALDQAKTNLDEIDAIGVTYGPGLVGALLVGVVAAKGLAFAKNKPLVPVHHIEGHIAANYITHPELEPPFLCLVVSGGHTHLVHVKDYHEYEIMGKTRDDAAGEAYDKVARSIGLGYPGGPKIDKLSLEGNPNAIVFPKAMMDSTYDFSFSGVKSAVLNYVNSCKMKNEEIPMADVAASFQKSVVDVLVSKTISLAKEKKIKKITLAGGVAANQGLRKEMEAVCKKYDMKLYYPKLNLCTDNAAMIGAAAFYEYRAGYRGDMKLNAVPNLPLGTKYQPKGV
ncbi:MAG: tRNA (adenosine(37)-N6)-threonylcarbamoyltransferase complex transferase subunit TsaD [Cellulosilyticaceae bacterium]